MNRFELNDKVKVILDGDRFDGFTGKVSSILENKTEKNIGVDIDVDGTDPRPYYYSEDELKKL